MNRRAFMRRMVIGVMASHLLWDRLGTIAEFDVVAEQGFIIYSISPVDTPFFSAVSRADLGTMSWTQDSLMREP